MQDPAQPDKTAVVESSQASSSTTATPDMATGTARYLRYILFAFFGLGVLYFISSSSIPASQLDHANQIIKEQGSRWKYPQATKSPSSANTAAPSTGSQEESTSPNPPLELASPKAAGPRMNATFVTLARNTDVWEIARSIRQVEDRFNKKFNYDWVFLNDKPFDAHFKKVTTALVSGTTKYGEIPHDHWSFPEFIDQEKAKKVREDMAERKIIYGDSISYRHMCRYESGFFFRHPIMQEYEWYWRVEPSIELYCDIDYDTFKYMADNNKKYSFVLSLYEYKETIPTLWESAKKFMKAHPEHIAQDNSMEWLSDDGGDAYNNCHFVRVAGSSLLTLLTL